MLMNCRELIHALMKCRADADVIFANTGSPMESTEVGFVRYCVRDNLIYFYEKEPEDFTEEETEGDIEIYETRRASNFVETSYREK